MCDSNPLIELRHDAPIRVISMIGWVKEVKTKPPLKACLSNQKLISLPSPMSHNILLKVSQMPSKYFQRGIIHLRAYGGSQVKILAIHTHENLAPKIISSVNKILEHFQEECLIHLVRTLIPRPHPLQLDNKPLITLNVV